MPNHPHRVWPLQGASNFRDLGGYPGHEGRPVRWRQLFRSDHLAGLTEADKSLLAGLGLARAFDFRGQAERAAVT
nr:tyrosine-protein phosphatase [Arenimonas sp.]